MYKQVRIRTLQDIAAMLRIPELSPRLEKARDSLVESCDTLLERVEAWEATGQEDIEAGLGEYITSLLDSTKKLVHIHNLTRERPVR